MAQIERSAKVETIPPVNPLQINLKYENLNVTLDGKIDRTLGNITNVQVLWGDGTSTYGMFPLTHNYAKKALYTISVTAHTTRDILVSNSINTIKFSPDINERLNLKLTLNTNKESQVQSQLIKENIPFTLYVYGDLTTYVGHIGIPRENLSLGYYSTTPQLRLIKEETITTNPNGHYDHDLSIQALPAGLYKVMIHGQDNYSFLNQTEDVFVPIQQFYI